MICDTCLEDTDSVDVHGNCVSCQYDYEYTWEEEYAPSYDETDYDRYDY